MRGRPKTSRAEGLLGVGLAALAVVATVYLLAPASLRRAWDGRGLPLRSIDDQWRDLGSETVAMASLLKQPRREGRPIPYRAGGGGLQFLTAPEAAGDPIVCPDGRVFAAQVPAPWGGWASAEWDGSAWRPLHPAPPPGERRPLVQRVICRPDGGVLLLADGALLDREGQLVAPRPPGNLLVTERGFYRLVETKTAFPLWFATRPEGPWLPIGGGRDIEGLATSKEGVIAWGRNVGRLVDSVPSWREWPRGFVPTSVGTLSAGGFIAWNDVRMYVASTFDAPMVEMPLPGRIREVVEGIDAPGVVWFVEGNHARRYALR